jgi:hypothetical protein
MIRPPDECKEWSRIAMVHGHEGVLRWASESRDALPPPQGRRMQFKMPNYGDVREHAPMPAIAIEKEIYRHDSIRKADRDLIRRVCAIFWRKAQFRVEPAKTDAN